MFEGRVVQALGRRESILHSLEHRRLRSRENFAKPAFRPALAGSRRIGIVCTADVTPIYSYYILPGGKVKFRISMRTMDILAAAIAFTGEDTSKRTVESISFFDSMHRKLKWRSLKAIGYSANRNVIPYPEKALPQSEIRDNPEHTNYFSGIGFELQKL